MAQRSVGWISSGPLNRDAMQSELMQSVDGAVPATRYSLKGKRVWVAGHRGMVGAALTRRLAREDCEIVTAERTRVDLRRQDQIEPWLNELRPHVIFLAA